MDCPQSELISLVTRIHDHGVKTIILAWVGDTGKNTWALYSDCFITSCFTFSPFFIQHTHVPSLKKVCRGRKGPIWHVK